MLVGADLEAIVLPRGATGPVETRSHPLTVMLCRAALGTFPPEDGEGEVVPALPDDPVEWVVSFTAHAVVATSLPAGEVLAWSLDGYGRALDPRFLLWLAGEGGAVGCQDAVLAAQGRGGGTLPIREDLDAHPRVRLARSRRRSVRVHGDDRGLVTVGRGLAGLLEMSVEATTSTPGAGRALVGEALGLVPPGEVVLAQVTPGNARSMRAFLAAGFAPIGSAVAITTPRAGRQPCRPRVSLPPTSASDPPPG